MPASDQLTLVGDHVRLEPLGLNDVPALVAAVAEDPASYRFSTVPQGESAMRAWVERALGERADRAALPFSIYSRDGERIVGSTRFYELQWWHPPADDGDPDACMIGYTWLAASAQGTSVNTEAKLLMLTHAFETWKVDRVGFRIDARNERSRASVQRLGATFEGVRRAERLGADGELRDSAYYSILVAEWPAAKHGLTSRLTACS
ncbi:MAG TPA: GNAT family protein [Solirubrobacteraceae bacterium]|nr:GNAT family protein [Solirubrobacteraceae bacterium]